MLFLRMIAIRLNRRPRFPPLMLMAQAQGLVPVMGHRPFSAIKRSRINQYRILINRKRLRLGLHF